MAKSSLFFEKMAMQWLNACGVRNQLNGNGAIRLMWPVMAHQWLAPAKAAEAGNRRQWRSWHSVMKMKASMSGYQWRNGVWSNGEMAMALFNNVA